MFADPTNLEDVMDSIRNAPTLGDVKHVIEAVFAQEWLLGVSSSYGTGYDDLNLNWIKVCSEIGVQPAQIAIVKMDIIDATNETKKDFRQRKLVAFLCELLTRAGFCVRSTNMFTVCIACNRVIPTEHVHNLLRAEGMMMYKNPCCAP